MVPTVVVLLNVLLQLKYSQYFKDFVSDQSSDVLNELIGH